jgi:hypothetical protein
MRATELYFHAFSPQATTGQLLIRYRKAVFRTIIHVKLNKPSIYRFQEVLLKARLHVNLIPTSHNKPSAYQFHRSSTEHSSTHKTLSQKTADLIPSSYIGSLLCATRQYSNCMFDYHNPQHARNLLVTQKRYCSRLYLYVQFS